MNHIETRIVLLLSKHLAAAPEGREKLDLIEELTDNLYQKYLELTSDGTMMEEEALSQVMDSLGDMNELVEFLIEETEKTDSGNPLDKKETAISAREEQLSFFEKRADEWEASATHHEKSHYQKQDDEFPEIVSTHIHSIQTDLKSTDLEIRFSDAASSINLDFDGDDIDVRETENGVLHIIRMEKKSSSFFSRFLSRSTSLTLTLPAKAWQRIDLCSSSGDITIDESLQCRELSVVTASGDVELSSVTAQNADLHTASGDITLTGDFEVLSAGTASGDIEIDGVRCNRANFGTASGDVTVNLFCNQLEIGTASGDVELDFSGQLPHTTTVGTASGDCSIQVSGNQGFRLNFETNSGDFHSDLPFSGERSTKNANLTYLTGGDCEISVSSASGDFEIYEG